MKSKITSVLRILVCIIMVFAIIGTVGITTADKLYTPEYLISQVSSTNTYENAYNSLMKRFSDNYSVSNIPKEVYEKSFSSEWMKASIDEKIRSNFENRDAVFDFSEAEKCITEYFEEYAHEKHVIKDETYENKLAQAVNYAQKTALNETDVYSFDVMNRAGIIGKISSAVELVRKYKYVCIGVLIVLLIIMIMLKRHVYWGGTALFSSGILMAVPTTIVLANHMIEKFSLKSFTTYTLVTGTLNSIVGIIQKTGFVLLATGVLFILIYCVFSKNERNAENEKNDNPVSP
ncbi:hypothetical protein [Ruminococcus flavefaciens]|uniref:hypothetical protein n=1 Tax=Ruminococcus flavefaciens TaxID=1265 RepID=UPI0026EC29F4|nr:hypothetical protein [Ruminococcus flavefaciens]